MLDKVFGITYYFVYAVELFLIGEGIFHNRVRDKAKYVIMSAVYLLVIIPTVVFLKNNAFIIMALNISVYIALFQGGVFSQIVRFGGVYLLTNMVESIMFGIGAVFLWPSIKHMEINTVRSGGVSLLFAVMVTGLILHIVHRKWTQHFIIYFRTLNWVQNLVVIGIVWSGILLFGFITVMFAENKFADNKKVSGMLFAVTVVFMGTALIGIVLLVFNVYNKDYYLKQNQMKEEIISMQQAYFQSVYDNDKEMRNFRHDINSQLGCLRLLLGDGKTDEALEHLNIIGNHFEDLTIQRHHMGNEILDVIINQKIQEAKKKGIIIEIEGNLDKPDFMDSYDLCVLFSNMLNNSIEACEKIQNQERNIKVFVLTHKNVIVLQFTNPATYEMYEALRMGRTTKADKRNHGIGMENIQRVVNKNGGKMQILYENGRVVIEVYFEI